MTHEAKVKYLKGLKCIQYFLIIMTLLPTVYIWSLPYLATFQFANCGDIGDDGGGSQTVSGYISTQTATAVMANTFFWPILFMWHGPNYKTTNRFSGLSFYSIFFFQVSFGLFLTFTNTYNGPYHNLSVLTFTFMGLVNVGYQYWRGIRHGLAGFMLIQGILGLAGVIGLALSKAKVGYWFWAVECFGLQGVIWYTPLLCIFGTDNQSISQMRLKSKTVILGDESKNQSLDVSR
jgi:hypothetical protein